MRDCLEPTRLRSTKVPLVVGGLTILMWVGTIGLAVALPAILAARGPMIVVDEEGAVTTGERTRSIAARRDVMAAIAGDPSELADRLRAAGFEDDPDAAARRRSRAFGAWMAALRYQDETSACTVLLEGSTSKVVEFVEIQATFDERVSAGEIVRVIGPTLSVLDPAVEPTMLVAMMHDGAGRLGRWQAERRPGDDGGMAVVLVTGALATAQAE